VRLKVTKETKVVLVIVCLVYVWPN